MRTLIVGFSDSLGAMVGLNLKVAHKMTQSTIAAPEPQPFDLVPKISLDFHRDKISGLNLYIYLVDFQIGPPELIAKGRQPSGHGNLYINGKDVHRLYGPFQHLPDRLFQPGVNLLTVSLNHHDDQPWIHAGLQVQARCFLDLDAQELILHSFSSSPPH